MQASKFYSSTAIGILKVEFSTFHKQGKRLRNFFKTE